MKLFAEITFTLVLLVLAYFYIINPINQISNCIEKSSNSFQNNDVQLAAQEKNKRLVCEYGREITKQLNDCVYEVKGDNVILNQFLIIVGQIKPTFRENYFSEMHNSGCGEFPDLIINYD